MQYQGAGAWPAPPLYYYFNTPTPAPSDSTKQFVTGDSLYVTYSNSAVSQGGCLAKYTLDGDLVWLRNFIVNGQYSSSPIEIVGLDASGNVVIHYGGINNGFGRSVYLVRYTPNGDYVSATQVQLPSPSTYQGTWSFKYDASGNLYASGWWNNTSQSSGYTYYGFLIKFNSNMTVAWARSYAASTGGVQGNPMTGSPAFDSSGNIYICGYTSFTSVARQMAVYKHDPSGNLLATRYYAITGGTEPYPYGITVDAADGVYVSFNYSSSGAKYGLMKLDTSLNVTWAKGFGAIPVGGGPVTVMTSGNVLIGGQTWAIVNSSGSVVSSASFSSGAGNFIQGGTTALVGYTYGPDGKVYVTRVPSDGSATGVYSLGGGYLYYGPGASSTSNLTITPTSQSLSASTGGFTTYSATFTSSTPTSSTSRTLITITPGIGSAPFLSPGTYTWIAPAGVTSVSAVAIGGGGGGTAGGYYTGAGGGGALGYRNNISVTPGSSYTVVVGAGGAAGNSSSPAGNAGGSSTVLGITAGGGGAGNTGGTSGGSASGAGVTGYSGGSGANGSSYRAAGAGGAGGYGGAGGNGGGTNSSGASGAGGAGGGGAAGGFYTGCAYEAARYGGSGGGVGIIGQGTSGTGGVFASTSNGASGGAGSFGAGTSFGGGGGAGGTDIVYTCCGVFYTYFSGSGGGNGAVRILWGSGRSFPSTSVGSP